MTKPFPDKKFDWNTCPFSNKSANECDTPMDAEHFTWHCEEMMRVGILERVGGADDPAEVRYRLKEEYR